VDIRTSIDAVASAVTIERPDLRSHTAPDGTVTILFSDIEGFIQMTERLGDQRAQQVLRGHNDIPMSSNPTTSPIFATPRRITPLSTSRTQHSLHSTSFEPLFL